MRHMPGRDDATAADLQLRSWKTKWPHYARVHHPEFVAGSLANGVSLNRLMAALKANSFRPTQRNAMKGDGNTDPRRAYMRQAAVEVSSEGKIWLAEQLERAFALHGKVPETALGDLDQPELQISRSAGQ